MKVVRNWMGVGFLLLAAIGQPALAAPPANDSFSAPVVISGFPATAAGSNVSATLEAGEPLPPGMETTAQASVWYRWMSPASAAVQIDTLGSDFNTRLAVWTGTNLASLVLLQAGNVHADESVALFSATSGVTYRIAVYGWMEDRGTIRLNVTNDMTSSIAGTLTTTDGTTRIFMAPAEAYRWNAAEAEWESMGSDLTGMDGRYEIDGLPAGTYRVQFGRWNSNFLPETYDDAPDLDSGTDIILPAATTISNINASLALASIISGTVTGPNGTTPLPDIHVSVYCWEDESARWNRTAFDHTDSNGFYSIGGLTAGTYRVKFEDPNGNHLSEAYNNATGVDTGTDIAVPASTTVTNINASLALASKISGIVTASDGVTPLLGIVAEAHLWQETEGWSGWEEMGSAQTDSNGLYAIGGLTAGTYRIRFWSPSQSYLSEAYNNATNLDLGADIVVPVAATVANINASLTAYSKISGTVTGPGGTPPLADIQVEAHRWNGYEWSGKDAVPTDSNGFYLIEGLDPGTWRVDFEDSSGEYLYETYNNATNLDSGTDIVVPVETTVPGISASLATSSRISGTVTGPDGIAPLPDIQVAAYQPSEYAWQGWQSRGSATTDIGGHYAINGLKPGSYRVLFQDESLSYFEEAYDDAPDLDSGDDVVVPTSTNVAGIDASLAAAAKITGTITASAGGIPLEDIKATAYQWQETEWWSQWVSKEEAFSDSNGFYSIGGLTAGTYRVVFSDWNTIYLSEAYNNAPDLTNGTDVVVPSATIVSGIDAALATYSIISGTVTASDGLTPLPDIQAVVYQWNELSADWTPIGSDYTDSDGHYAIGGLISGTYRVAFWDEDNGVYAAEAYNDARTVDSGTDIILPMATTVAGIDASLALRSTISGTVTASNGLTPLPNIQVTACKFQLGWESYRSSTTDADGHYTISGLEAGTYRVRFHDDQNGNYAPEAYNDAADVNSGTDIVVAASTAVIGINASLAPASKISGTVTAADGLTPLPNIVVSVCFWNSQWIAWSTLGWTNTDAAGHYLIGGLAPGTYRVGFQDWSGTYRYEAYDNATGLDFGADVVLPASTTLLNVNAALARVDMPEQPVMAGVARTETNGFQILFTGLAGQQHILQETTSLTNPWNFVGNPFACASGTNFVPVVPTPPATFWRVVPYP